ncbi:hypothetical protein AMTRI_Chr04g179600 [Amborella trichopoda]
MKRTVCHARSGGLAVQPLRACFQLCCRKLGFLLYMYYFILLLDIFFPPAPPISKRSIIEGIDAFISEAIEGYHAATWRACFCAHVLLQLPRFSFETEGTKQALAIVFCKAAFSRSLDIRSMPVALRKLFLLVIASRYICCFGYIKKVLEKDEDEGLTGVCC